MYIPVKAKFSISFIYATLWAIFAIWVAYGWIIDITGVFSLFTAIMIIMGIAIMPGFINAFLVASLLLDNRPKRKITGSYPPITLLISENENIASIYSILNSISKQKYSGDITAIVISRNSDIKDSSINEKYNWAHILNVDKGLSKGEALNAALEYVKTDLFITIDGNSYFFTDAIKNIVERFISDPPDTAAVAGSILVRNSKTNILTKIQEWDYFHGIAAINRLHSLYQGTLISEGTFSLYKTSVVKEVGGWVSSAGEDTVLNWAILESDKRVGFAEDAIVFTIVPETLIGYIRHKQERSSGLLVAFKRHWKLLFMHEMSTLFVWWNLLFPYMDLVYTVAFIPGILMAMFGIYWIIVPMIVILLPMSLLVNLVMFRIQSKMFIDNRLNIRRNVFACIRYAFLYNIFLRPAGVIGYVIEILNKFKK